jgi:hypothetical protein
VKVGEESKIDGRTREAGEKRRREKRVGDAEETKRERT